ncbi:MAG: restriction endonuclease [Desulfomonilaceae bacterium]
MLFKCFRCNLINFHEECPVCSPEAENLNVPLDPNYYPEFKYKSKGIFKDILFKKESEKKLQEDLSAVLKKYSQFERPYFVNFVHYTGLSGTNSFTKDMDNDLRLFHAVLTRIGFKELNQYLSLTWRLAFTTLLREEYLDFVNRVSNYNAGKLRSVLESWIGEVGSLFRYNLPMMLYFLWEKGSYADEVKFSNQTIPLVDANELHRLSQTCETIYFDFLVSRFKLTLENFDPSRFVTIYAVDQMGGYEFEDFIGKVLTVIGYGVEVTKRSGDQGADLFAERFGKKIVIQAKNYTSNVGNSAVQQVLAAKGLYQCDEAVVITNSYFTSSAQELAQGTGVKLVDRNELQTYLDEYNQVIMQTQKD